MRVWDLAPIAILACVVHTVASITFETKTETYVEEDFLTAFHIENDARQTNQLLISTFVSVRTVKNKTLGSVAGLDYATEGYNEKKDRHSRAVFDKVTGFVQTANGTRILLADQNNHCLRTLDLETPYNLTYTFAGKCRDYGREDGSLLEARFNRPYTVIAGYYSKEYYVADTNNYAIRLISETTSQVTTIAKLVEKPRGIVLDRARKQLLVVVNATLYSISIGDSNEIQKLDVITPQSYPLATVRQMTSLHPNYYLMANWAKTKKSLLLLNMASMNVSLVDNKKVYSMCLSRDKQSIFIGTANRIEKINVTGIPPEGENASNTDIVPRPTTTITTMTTTMPQMSSFTMSDEVTGDEILANWTTFLMTGLAVVVIIMMVAILLTVLRNRRRRRSRRRADHMRSLYPPDQGSLISYECPTTVAPPPPAVNGVDQQGNSYMDHTDATDNASNPYEPVVVQISANGTANSERSMRQQVNSPYEHMRQNLEPSSLGLLPAKAGEKTNPQTLQHHYEHLQNYTTGSKTNSEKDLESNGRSSSSSSEFSSGSSARLSTTDEQTSLINLDRRQ